MLPEPRRHFEHIFSEERYRAFVDAVTTAAGVPIEFRLSETPCFFSAGLMESLVAAAQTMTRQLLEDELYRSAADAMVPDRFRLAGGEALPTCMQVDFGLVRTGTGAVEGRLVELQAFPSLYGFQMLLAEEAVRYAEVDLTPYLSHLSTTSYIELIRSTFLGPHEPDHVVLMEIQPQKQKTRPDFTVTEKIWGIRAVDTADVIREGRQLFYLRDGKLTPIKRIYNRVIPDELVRSGAAMSFDYRDDLDVEWIGGPDWFFRISKFSLPWIEHPWVPETHFLSEVGSLPVERDDWLLKPLFSFAGGGIIFGPTDKDIAAIPPDKRHLYILQRRVSFTPVIRTPEGDTQAELRIMMVRDGNDYRAVMPLVRMGRGKMMGVDHNKGLRFVGAAAGLVSRHAAI
jgi:hypothetical protein